MLVNFTPDFNLQQFIIDNLFASLSLVGTVVACIVVVVWQIAAHKFKYDQACQDVDDLSKKYAKTSQDISSIKSRIGAITDMLSVFIGSEKRVIESDSPATLTDFGLQLIVDSPMTVAAYENGISSRSS